MTDKEFKELIDNQVCHLGEGAPDASLGKEFDLYIDKLNHRFYRKSNDVWTSAPKEVIGQCVSYLKKDDLKEVVDEFLVASGDGAAMVQKHNADADAHLTGFNHRLTSNQLFDYSLLPNTDFIQKGHLEDRIKSADAIKEHEKLVASNTDLGHIKVDGNSIIVEDGVAKSVGGKLIGEIFAYPSKVPPEGSYALDGQTIENCRELHPEFYQWILDNRGENKTIPLYKDWQMPSLTKNGTVGFTVYAVEASGDVVSGHEVFKSFDYIHGGSGSFCNIANATEAYLTFYAPRRIQFSSLHFKFPTAGTVNQRIVNYKIYLSNDNFTWKEVAKGNIESTANSAEKTIEIPLSNYDLINVGYQYIKILGSNGGGTSVAFPEITLEGSEFLRYAHSTSGNIFVTNKAFWDSILEANSVCGAFALDEEKGDITLPYLINATLWGADFGGIGESLPAGLPNIEGDFYTHTQSAERATTYTTGAFEFTGLNLGAGGTGSNQSGQTFFDASRSNSVYGNSDTVQPRAMAITWCIQVYNTASVLSTQESAQLTSQMQTKAQKDLVNVDNNIDFVVDSWDDGAGNWYRKYRSGWIEQGGKLGQPSSNGWSTVTFLIEMQNTHYFPLKMYTSNSSAGTTERALGVCNLTKTSMDIYLISTSPKTFWQVNGFYAK
jgi:hypothetical protein